MTVEDYTNQLLGPDDLEKFIEFARNTGCFRSMDADLPSAGCEGRSDYFVRTREMTEGGIG